MEADEISRRLKAARWLAGGTDQRGRPTPLTPQALAAREPLRRNAITANRLMEFEQLVTQARDMELKVVAEALGLPDWWFTADDFRTSGAGSVIDATAGGAFIARAIEGITARLERLDQRLDAVFGDEDRRAAVSDFGEFVDPAGPPDATGQRDVEAQPHRETRGAGRGGSPPR